MFNKMEITSLNIILLFYGHVKKKRKMRFDVVQVLKYLNVTKDFDPILKNNI